MPQVLQRDRLAAVVVVEIGLAVHDPVSYTHLDVYKRQVYAGWLYGDNGITLAGTLALSLGIAIQNFPEGAIISMPLKAEGVSKSRSFLYGTLSGAVEPVGAILTILLAGILVPVLPLSLIHI